MYGERSLFQTGDVILMDGKGAASGAIKWFSSSGWSHVGVIVRIEKPFDAVCLAESSTLINVPDLRSGQFLRGVQLTLLSERIKNYEGHRIGWRRLHHRIPKERVAEVTCAFREEMRNRPYEDSVLELIRSAYDGPGGANEEDLRAIFCSELVAEYYQRLGLLQEPPVGLPSNEYNPGTFSHHGKKRGVVDPVNLWIGENAGARLEPERLIYPAPTVTVSEED